MTVVSRIAPEVVQTAVLVCSDRCAAGQAEDRAGPAVAELLQERLAARIAWLGVCADDRDEIEARLQALAARRLDLVCTAGGTGCGPRDVTPEATRAVIEREVPGLAERMRQASAKITPHAWLQRGVCGTIGATLVVNLPGSTRAATENLEAILDVLPHAIELLRGQTDHGTWLR